MTNRKRKLLSEQGSHDRQNLRNELDQLRAQMLLHFADWSHTQMRESLERAEVIKRLLKI